MKVKSRYNLWAVFQTSIFPRKRANTDMEHSEGFLKLVAETKKRIHEISVEATLERMHADEGARLIDVREDNEWQAGHAAGAEHLGKGIIERDIEVRVPDSSTELILYCGGGFRSALAADNLQKMGYTNAISMDGGIREWRDKNYPLVHD
jgi:rhodanese-related sulfurtransferase